MAAYSYYKAGKYDDSIRITDYFISSNPVSKNLPYMYYLKGLSYYSRMDSMGRARSTIESAKESFEDLLAKYPNSKYKNDIVQRLKKIETYLAGNEMNLAIYYLNKGNYIGAVHHLIVILDSYPESNFVPEALYRLVEINSLLKFDHDSSKFYEMLTKKYKTNEWTSLAAKIVKK